MKTRPMLAAGIATALAPILIAASAAATPRHHSEGDQVHVIASCGPGDELILDATITEAVTEFDSGRASLHLALVGTFTRTATGRVGKYSERQRDFFSPDGSEKYVGVLGHLVVAGGRGFTWSGHAQLDANGILSATPGLQTLLALGEEEFISTVCSALAGQQGHQ